MATRTITLTGRPPVRIEDDHWPTIASASDSEVDCQANCKSSWVVKVRRHEDGRAIVYAVYSYSSLDGGARDLSAKRGILLTAGSTPQDIVTAIREVCADIATAEHAEGDTERWDTLAHECVADMPAETL